MMKIWFGIFSFLNYLYNHLIDLVWTKKIRFADGTEMTTVPNGNNLYDIKILSQAIADKGFAFMCHTTTRALLKSDVPTLYNDIKAKYDNADVQVSGFQSLSGNGTIGYNCAGFSNGYLYVVKDDNGNNEFRLYRTSINDLSNPVWELMSNEDLSYTINSEFNFIITDKIIAIIGQEYNTMWGVRLKVFTLDGNKIYDHFYDVDSMDSRYALSLVEEDNNEKYIYISVGVFDSNNFPLYRFKNDYTVNIENVATTPTYVTDIIRANGYYFFIYDNRNDNKLYRTTNWTNLEFLVGDIGGSFAIIGQTIRTEQGSWSARISFDNGNTWQDLVWNVDIQARFKKFNNIEKYICNKSNGANYDLYITTDLINFTQIATNINYAENFAFNEDNSFVLSMYGYDVLFSGISKKQYTDTCNINGTNVNINYYKFQDFKICISDNGGTNDMNIKTVYDYLGYSNYWLLDITNETITIQRNKQGYVSMYVGDDFVDDLEDLPTISTRVLPQAEEITDSSASVILDVLPNKNYKLTNNAITNITLNSCQESPIETTIKFSTGNSAPTLTDNSNITWVDGATPVLNANSNYIILIWNKIGFIREY